MESDRKLSKKRLMEIKKENDEKRYNLFVQKRRQNLQRDEDKINLKDVDLVSSNQI